MDEKKLADLRKTWERRKRYRGAGNPLTMAALNSLVTYLWNNREYAQLLPLQKEYCQCMLKESGVTAKLIEELAYLAFAASRSGRRPQARDILFNLRNICMSGDESLKASRLKVLQLLSSVLGDMDSHAQKCMIDRELLEECRAVKGPESAYTIHAMQRYAWSLYCIGRSSDSCHIYGELAEISARVNGPAHATTISALRSRCNLLYNLGRTKEELEARLHLWERAVSGWKEPERLEEFENVIGCFRKCINRSLPERERLLADECRFLAGLQSDPCLRRPAVREMFLILLGLGHNHEALLLLSRHKSFLSKDSECMLRLAESLEASGSKEQAAKLAAHLLRRLSPEDSSDAKSILRVRLLLSRTAS